MSSRIITYVSEDHSWLEKLCINGIEILTGRNHLENVYATVKASRPAPEEIWAAALDQLQIDLDYDKGQLTNIPRTGPLVIIANHPFGVVDGLALGALTLKVRPDFRFPVNSVLFRDEDLNRFMLPIDFAPTREAMRTNIKTKGQILDHLRQGGTLAIFPAGGVATAKHVFGKAEDLEWKRFTAKVIQQSQATVVPIFFHGQNSWGFQLASYFSQTLRLGMLLHEVCNKQAQTLKVEIGAPISYDELAPYRDRQVLLDYLEKRTFDLARNNDHR